MTKFKTILLGLLATASVIASLMIHHRADAVLQERAEISRQQSQQLADLQAEQRRLSNSPVPVATRILSDHSAEIARLRAEAESLRNQTNKLAQPSKFRAGSQSSSPAPPIKTYTPEYLEQWRKLQGTKGSEARDLAYAMTEYVRDHQNQFPSSLDQLNSYLEKEHRTLSGTNHFEIIFQGSLDELNGLPSGSIAVVRETQTWLAPDGRAARVYGMAGGVGQTVTSDDNFQSWEAEHVIPPASASGH